VVLDVDGGDVQLDAREIARLVDMKIASINVEFWLSPDVNLTCNFAWIPLGVEVQMYYLDNLTLGQSEAVESVLIKYIHQEASSTFGYVLDRNGRTAEYDWNGFYDDYSLGRPRRVDVLPDIMAVAGSPERVREILDIPDSSVLDQLGDTLVEVKRISARGDSMS
jgi:hypothetical protein